MLQSPSQPQDPWLDAVAVVEQLDASARATPDPESFYREALAGVRTTLSGYRCLLTLIDASGSRLLAGDSELDSPSVRRDGQLGQCRGDATLVVAHQLGEGVSIRLSCEFAEPLVAARNVIATEFLRSILDLCVYVFLVDQFSREHRDDGSSSLSDAFLDRLFADVGSGAKTGPAAETGPGADEQRLAAHRICCAVADRTGADRVALCRMIHGKASLLTTSTQSQVSHRSRQVRQLEGLATEVAIQNAAMGFSVGAGDAVDGPVRAVDGPVRAVDGPVRESLLEYIDESGVRQLLVAPLSRLDTGEVDTVLALERFRLDSSSHAKSMPETFREINAVVASAVRSLMRRTPAPRSAIPGIWHSASKRQRIALLLAVFVAVASLLMLPIKFRLPVQGVIRPMERLRIYSPTAGTVMEIPVADGDLLDVGATLVVLHSPEVELRHESAIGDLATAETSLASLQAAKSRTNSARTTSAAIINASADEVVLKTRIESLRKQLQLLKEVRESLTVKSTAAGRISRWDRQGDLVGRNVPQGQLLLEVIATDAGYFAELELLDKDYGYLQELHGEALNSGTRIECSLRRRSDPDSSYSGVMESLGDTVHINHHGERVVQLTVPIVLQRERDVPLGATVIGSIDCGKRSLGFVLFRPVIEWVRSRAW